MPILDIHRRFLDLVHPCIQISIDEFWLDACECAVAYEAQKCFQRKAISQKRLFSLVLLRIFQELFNELVEVDGLLRGDVFDTKGLLGNLSFDFFEDR